MLLKKITLLSREEYIKYHPIIPVVNARWWLKTSYYDRNIDYVTVAADLGSSSYIVSDIGVRPCCIFELDSSDAAFWCKPEMLIGTKVRFGNYEWTVVDIKEGKIRTLCDQIIAKRRFDCDGNFCCLEDADLGLWLVNEGLKLITA